MTAFVAYLEDDTESYRLEAALQRLGVQTVVCRLVGMNGKSDEEFATANGYVLCTGNGRDFFRLHREYMEAGRTHSGIIVRTARNLSFEEEARRILRIWETLSAEEMVNRTESLSHWSDERA